MDNKFAPENQLIHLWNTLKKDLGKQRAERDFGDATVDHFPTTESPRKLNEEDALRIRNDDALSDGPLFSETDSGSVSDSQATQETRSCCRLKNIFGSSDLSAAIAEDPVASRRFRYVPGSETRKRGNPPPRVSTAVQEVENDQEFITGRMELAKRNKQQEMRAASYRHATKSVSYIATLYGQSMKSLGTVRNSFRPPVKAEDEQALEGGPHSSSCEELGSLTTGSGSDAIASKSEALKNCDPKLIDLILCEIIDRQPPVTWDEVAGLESAKRAIKEMVIWPMLRPDIFTGLRAPSKGMLLFGPPGTGKTLIGKCIASQCKATFFSVSASSLTSKWVGEGEKLVRALFAVARDRLPSVIFIDEVDSLLTQRCDSEHESSRRLKNEFFSQMDGLGISKEERLLVVGATNRPQELDEAARRRFTKRLYIPLPDRTARTEIVRHLLKSQLNLLTDSEIESISDMTEGYSGADVTELCKEAAMCPLRQISNIEQIAADQVPPITFADFEQSLKAVKSSVSREEVSSYTKWNDQFGSCS